MSIVQTYVVNVREDSFIVNGFNQTYTWHEEIRHRGPFATAQSNPYGGGWKVMDLAGNTVTSNASEAEAILMCVGVE